MNIVIDNAFFAHIFAIDERRHQNCYQSKVINGFQKKKRILFPLETK